MTYLEKLQLPEWRNLRDRIIKERNYTCEDCDAQFDSALLNLHHKYYEPGKEPWEYPDDVFKVLCLDCHNLTHEALISLQYAVGRLTGNQIVELSSSLLNAFVETEDPRAIHNWLQLCLSDVRRVRLEVP